MSESLRRFGARFREMLRRDTIANELREELAAHLDMEIEHNIALGMSADEAKRAALTAFGGVEQFREQTNNARGFVVVEQIARDVRFAARRLRRTPAFTIGVVGTLGIGLGGAVGLGILTHTVLLSPLPYADPDRIVRIEVETPGLGTATTESSPGMYQLFRERSRSIALLGAYYENDGITLQGRGAPERTTAAMVTPSVFRILGTRPALGRLPNDAGSPDDTIPVLISAEIWQRHFGGDSSVIGRTITLNRFPRRVVGVMPRGFDFPSPDVGVWFPGEEKATNAGLSNRYLSVIGRLREGATVEQANAEVATIVAGIAQRYPELSADAVRESRLHASARTLRSAMVAPVRSDLILLAAVAALVLFIAFTNVATLVLLRAEGVRGEIAVSQALGAGGVAITQRLVAEGLVLAFGGLVVAMPVALTILTTKLGFAADQVPRLHEVHATMPAVLTTSIAAIVIGVVLGLIAALRTRHALADGGLIGQGPRATGSAAWRRSRQALVAAQVAMALAVLLGSGLMARSLRNLHHVDLGFVAHDGVTFSTPLPFSSYDKYQKTVAFHLRVVDALRALPGVSGAAAAMQLPLTPGWDGLEGRLEASSASRTLRATASSSVVTAEYFAVMGIPLRGRTFERGDYIAPTPSVIISRSLAKALFGGDDPLGKEVKIADAPSYPAYRVVGVVGDVYGNRIADGPLRSLYFPFVADLAPSSLEKPRIPYNPSARYVVRTDAPVALMLPEFRRIVASIDPQLPVTELATFDGLVASAMSRVRIATTLLVAAAIAALLLGTVGVYSVIAFAVAGRTREFAVRIAVGAPTRSIIDLVFREGLAMLAVGIAAGVGLSIGSMRLIQNVLYAVSIHDGVTYAATVGLVLVTAMVAIYLPARRAAATDPARVLRSS